MKISVKVKAGAKSEKLEEVSHGAYCAWVKAPAKEGRANQAVIDLLSRHFGLAKTRIAILKGRTSKNKLIVL